MSSTELHSTISAINANPSLNSLQKTQHIQQVLSANFCSPVSQQVNNCATVCQHYKTKKCANFYFDCCQVIDPCHRCHHARGCELKPPRISSITCSVCHRSQPPGPSCTQCGIQFSKSYCDQCKIWTDLEIFHCDKCTVCRVGKASDMFHCDNCDACFSIEGRQSHRCAKTKLKDSNCPICLESLHTAQKFSSILPCGHGVHGECWRQAATRGEFRCPTCRKSLIDMRGVWENMRRTIAANPIPRGMFPIRDGDLTNSPFGLFCVEHKRIESSSGAVCEGYFPDWTLANGSKAKGFISEKELERKLDVYVWCYDCESTTCSSLHPVGTECKKCGSFNTTRD